MIVEWAIKVSHFRSHNLKWISLHVSWGGLLYSRPNVSTLQSSVFIRGDLMLQRCFLHTQGMTPFAIIFIFMEKNSTFDIKIMDKFALQIFASSPDSVMQGYRNHGCSGCSCTRYLFYSQRYGCTTGALWVHIAQRDKNIINIFHK